MTKPDSVDVKKYLRAGRDLIWVSLLFALLLVPDRLLAESELTPPLPSIGSVSATTKEFGYKNIKRDINRLGAAEVFFSLYDTQGNPFFSSPFTYIKDGKLVPVRMDFIVDLEKSDGQYLAQYPVGLFAYPFGGGTEAPLTLGVNTLNIRSKPCYGPTFPCTPEEGNRLSNFFVNPFTPGPVYLRKVDIKLVTGQGEVIAQTTYNTRTKLFTMGQPPRLTSISKTSLDAGETAAITGSNFDIYNATEADNVNRLHFDLGPANNLGGYQESRVINWVGNWWEDWVHYCGPTKIKFDMPPNIMIDPSQTQSRQWEFLPMPAGAHTVTLQNEWGFSNPITFTYTGVVNPSDVWFTRNYGWAAASENDPACQNPPGVITSISPISGPAGTVVTINGTGFSNYRAPYRGDVSNNAITFGGVPADNSYLVDLKYERYTDPDTGLPAVTGTQIRMKVPPEARTGPVTVKPDGKFTIWGPTFTVTAGQVSPTPTPSVGGGGGAAVVEPPIINSVTPPSINVGAENTILIQGFGLQGSSLEVGIPAITVIDVATNESGTNLRAILAVDPEVLSNSVIVTVVNEAGRADAVLGLTQLSAQAPVIEDVQVSPLDEQNQATITVSGENFEGSQVEIVGGSVIIKDVAIEPNEIRVVVEASEFYSSENSWDPITLTKKFLALAGTPPAATNPAAVIVTRGSDQVTAPADMPRATTSPAGPGFRPLPFSFRLENPLKGGIKSIPELFNLIGQFIFNLAIPVAVIIIIYAGFLMLTSGGNPTQYGKGLTALKYAALGLAVVLISKGFVSLIKSILSVK